MILEYIIHYFMKIGILLCLGNAEIAAELGNGERCPRGETDECVAEII